MMEAVNTITVQNNTVMEAVDTITVQNYTVIETDQQTHVMS